MKRRSGFKYSFLLMMMACLFFEHAVIVHAEDVSYDRYASLYEKKPVPPSTAGNIAKHFLVYPFELFKWPVDKALNFIEKNHIDDKTIWLYEKMQDYGITPYFSLFSINHTGFGGKFDFVRLAQQRTKYPNLKLNGWILESINEAFDVGTEVGVERIAETGFGILGFFDYQHLVQEHFYGIGPHTSAGDGYVYEREALTLASILRYQWTPTTRTDFRFGYQNVDIDGGKDGGRGQIGEGIFNKTLTPGLDGDDLLDYEVEIQRETRNFKDCSTRGGLYRFNFGFHEGVNSSKAQFFKYQAELMHYFPLWSDRRILFVRLFGEHSDRMNGVIPFHQMARLGGYGYRYWHMPNEGQTLRSYDYNRFTDTSALLMNLEYRYTIWEYRDFKTDAVFSWDEGQVFRNLDEFQFEDFRASYGLGFRLSFAHHPVLTFEMAHGDEGTNFYVKSHTPF
ncbi:MAG: BamA/TamA family outer membrane protein [Candidatus Omnitrophica bacterium]|nr:BamA/TamA family outer membrane protein [Candidatus Omnitrophota bacterium]MDD5670182.1 BamA/TamA family outer membrane protein [Candidatus Omnitrophota bacterium]